MLAAVLALLAAFLWWPPPVAGRLARLSPDAEATTRLRRRASGRSGRPWWMSPWLSAAVAVFAMTRVVPGLPGLAVGLLAAAAVVLVLRSAATASQVRRREQVAADLPLAVDLLVACVSAGRPPGRSLSVVADAVGGPLGEDLRAVAGRLELGADPLAVWRDLATDEVFAPLGRSLARSARTGSSINMALARCADDLRRARHADADARARKVSVRASAPLGVCFLPAFLLVGVVPTIVGGLQSLSW